MRLLDRIIFHCDCNSFYASVELLDHPELHHHPVAVCGDPDARHGIILAKNEPAKVFGVKTAETVWQARAKCPDLILLPAHHDRYRAYSKQVNTIYEQYTDLVEPFGIDESWLDMTGSLHLFGQEPRLVADGLRAAIRKKLGLTLSIGISFNKVFAKLGSDYKKPDATTLISLENFRDIVWPLPVTDLLFVGHSAQQLLSRQNIRTIGQLAAADPQRLTELMGKQGKQLWRYANGLDTSPVQPTGVYTPPKSVGNGETFAQNLVGWPSVRRGVSLLADQVAVRLRRHHLKATTLQVTIRDPRFHDICRQKPLPAPTCVARELSGAAMELICSAWSVSAPIRAITLTAHNLVPEDQAVEQLDLFHLKDTQRRDRLERLERTIDGIRQKYGPDSLLPAGQKEDFPKP